MTTHYRLLLVPFLVVAGLWLLAGGPWGASAMAGAAAPTPQGGGDRLGRSAQTGMLTFLGFDPGHSPNVPAARAAGGDFASAGQAFLEVYGPKFGLDDPVRDVRLLRAGADGRGHPSARFQQEHQGIPVFGGEILVNMDNEGNLTSISGEISPALSIEVEPRISASDAERMALGAVAKYQEVDPSDLVADEPQLWIYDERLLMPSTRPEELVWRTEVRSTGGAPIRELVLINSIHGGISLHFNQVDTSWVDGSGAARGPGSLVQQETETPEAVPSDTPGATDTPMEPAETPMGPSDTMVPTDTPASSETPVPSEEPSGTPSDEPSATDTPVATATETASETPTYSRPTQVQGLGGGLRDTWTANNTTTLPGITLLCDETDADCTGGTNPHADGAHTHAADAYDFYDDHHGRDSLDGAGMTIVSTVHFGTDFFNAFWNGDQMVYGDAAGFPLADDVVGHEFTHGVTQFESNLFYYYQSGAINESFSDVWGEFIDLTNGTGNDASSVRWLMGEEISGFGALRNMSNPPAFGDPDRILSPLYFRISDFDSYTGMGDNGGVHTNSGVNNKAAFLLTDGGTFNGYTVRGLDIDKTAAIYYEAQINLLTSAADYYDLYFALYQACLNVIGAEGITASDCLEVRDATNAVQMNLQPISGYNPEAAACPANTTLHQTLFADDLESGAGNFVFGVIDPPSRWDIDSPYGPFAHSGVRFLYGDDFPQSVEFFPPPEDFDFASDSFAAMTSDVPLPGGAHLWFAHAFGFEDPNWDGGVLEYSTNGGATWVDAGQLFSDGRGYGGTMFDSSMFFGGNPLGGRKGFIGDSHGYVSSRYNLASLAGQSVRFRWRIGTDFWGFDWGWWLDDVQIHTCLGVPAVPSLLTPAANALQGTQPTLDWADAANADHYELRVASDSGFTSLVVNQDVTPSTFTFGSDLANNATYWWRVRTVNALGQLSNWSLVRTFRTKLAAPTGLTSDDAGLTTRPTFKWTAVPGPLSGYTIQVSTSVGFATTVVNATTAAVQYMTAVDLPRDVEVFWRVRANGTNGPSDWANGTSFTGANPPSVPVLVSPASNLLVPVSPAPGLDWGDSTGGVPGLDHYQVQVATNSTFGTIVEDEEAPVSTHTILASLETNKTHWWRVRSVNGDGEYSNWSLVRTFRTLIATPVLSAPVEGQVVTTLKPTFTWSNVGATSYTLQVSTNNLFTTFVVNVNPTTTTFTHTTNLPTQKVLEVRVRANGANGPSPWSPVVSFMIVP